MNAIVATDSNGSGNLTYISRDSYKSIAGGSDSKPTIDTSTRKATLTLSKYSQGLVIGQNIMSITYE